MKSLDTVSAMKAIDPKNVLGSIDLFPDQCQQAWDDVAKLTFPKEYSSADSILVAGMGGSRFTPRTIKEYCFGELTVPYEITDDYRTPGFVGKNTLVILSSYSGTTEEVLTIGKEALKRGAMVTGVMAGGAIGAFLTENHLPYYAFNPKNNPSGQPRIGGGYLLLGHLALLSKLGYIPDQTTIVQTAIQEARKYATLVSADVPEAQNPAKQLARTLLGTHPFLVVSEFLRGWVNGFANQINETAKMISDFRYIPELNHHLMEGLKRPETLHENGLFVFFHSDLYSPQIQKRFDITKTVVEKQQVKTLDIRMTGSTPFSQILMGNVLGSYTTFYMAMLTDTDPVAIPWVDYFKKELSK